ncbi:hypothetical protein [Geothrix alkalitolerans]|uniref:hypothetical protein n=1 Tax=Geothrix alkalitolerans TaxID=2922724 RepID=UPI001FAEF8EB|nr:hypothetical protein [Geothrix alkalitolerans]
MKKFLDHLRLTVWTADFAWRVFTAIIIFAGSTTAAFLAYGKTLLLKFGISIWLGFILIIALLLSIIFYFINKARQASAETRLYNKLALEPSSINPLLNNFENKIIPMHSLTLPSSQLHQHKLFRNCKFVGPGVVAIVGSNITNCSFNDIADILILPDPFKSTGVTVFMNCTLDSCEFIKVTLMLPKESAAQLSKLPGVTVATYSK